MRMKADPPVDMVYSVKGDRLRTDYVAGAASMYFIRQGDKNTMVMPTSKMYAEQSISASMAAVQTGKGRTAAANAPKIKRTGKKEMIAGWQCEHVISTDAEGSTDVCLAHGLGTFAVAGGPTGNRGRGAADPMSSFGQFDGFPLKVQKVGGATVMLVTKIERKPLDEQLFAIPADFKKIDMSGMGRSPER